MSGESRHLWRYTDSRLQQWGDWVARHQDDEHGLPHKAAFIDEGRGGGHRIPIASMPRKVAEISRTVNNLPELQREALWVHYVFVLDPDGRTWAVEQKAVLLKIPVRTLRFRITEGRRSVALAIW